MTIMTGKQAVARRDGFTLVEMLIVVAILALLGSLMLVASREVFRRINTNDTLMVMQEIQSVIREYKNQFGVFPPSDGGTKDLIGYLDKVSKAKMEAILKKENYDSGKIFDAWKQEVRYGWADKDLDFHYSAASSAEGYSKARDHWKSKNKTSILHSPGPDGEWGTVDDILSPK